MLVKKSMIIWRKEILDLTIKWPILIMLKARVFLKSSSCQKELERYHIYYQQCVHSIISLYLHLFNIFICTSGCNLSNDILMLTTLRKCCLIPGWEFQIVILKLLTLWFQVLAVFNLRDPQSQFGDWMSLFLQAAFMAEGIKIVI